MAQVPGFPEGRIGSLRINPSAFVRWDDAELDLPAHGLPGNPDSSGIFALIHTLTSALLHVSNVSTLFYVLKPSVFVRRAAPASRRSGKDPWSFTQSPSIRRSPHAPAPWPRSAFLFDLPEFRTHSPIIESWGHSLSFHHRDHGLLSQLVKRHAGTMKAHHQIPNRPMPILPNEYFRLALVRGLVVIHFVAIEKHDDIGIAFQVPAFP